MSLHAIVEPAGALQTGWNLSEKDPKKADIRNPEAPKPAPAPKTRSPKTRSKWELAEVR